MNLLKIDIDDETDISNVVLPKEYLDGLKDTFKTVLEFLQKHDIDYFIDGGTLLGCVRERGQIIWDDDIDLGMTECNFFKFKKVLQELSNTTGLQAQDFIDVNIIKVANPKIAFVRNFKLEGMDDIVESEPRYAGMDIFLYVLNKKNEYVLDNENVRNLFIEAKYHKNDLFPLKEYEYEDIKVKGANNPYPYLNNYYGDWNKRCIHIYK